MIKEMEMINQYLKQIKEVKKEIYDNHKRKNLAWKYYSPDFKEAPFWKRFVGKEKTKEEFIKNVNKMIDDGVKVIKRLILDCAEDIKKEKS